jgi:hypothetical protein
MVVAAVATTTTATGKTSSALLMLVLLTTMTILFPLSHQKRSCWWGGCSESLFVAVVNFCFYQLTVLFV